VSPARRRQAVARAMTAFQISERRACRALGVPRSSQRYVGTEREREEELLLRVRALAREHPRYGYRRIRALLVREGWSINLKRVHRLWRREGLKVPQIQRKRRRLGSSENGCIRHRAERPNHVWSYDFVMDQTAEGRRLKLLPVVDEFTRECLTIEVERSLVAEDVISTLEYLFEVRGVPEHIRSDNGPEFIAEAVKSWLAHRGSKTLYIEPGSPWENAYSETFNSRLRDELLDREVFETLKEAKVILEDHRLEYNHRRPHSSLGYRTPAEFAAACVGPGVASLPPDDTVPIPDPVLS
jgi:putative transposase